MAGLTARARMVSGLWLCHPSRHGHSTLAQAPILPPALQGWPCHPLTNALQGADRTGNTLIPTNILVHTGHLQEAGGSPGPWPRWAAGRGRTQPYWDLRG